MPVAIILAGVIIGAAILATFRWELAAYGGETYRLDRWSGKIVACNATSEQRLGGSQLGVGIVHRCAELTPSEVDKKAVDKSIK